MLDKLAVEAPDAELVFLGDYIDRGEQSAQVLRRLMALDDASFLLGNHERMFLNFMDDPKGKGARWLDY
ncbi:metallophosphoesterase, partial [Cognatishimia activa]